MHHWTKFGLYAAFLWRVIHKDKFEAIIFQCHFIYRVLLLSDFKFTIYIWHGVQIVSNVWFKFQYSFCVYISVPRPDFFYGIFMCKICGVHGSYSVVEPSQLLATHTTAMHTLGRWLSFARDAGSCDDVRPRWLTLSQPCHHFPPITGRQTTHVRGCGRSN